VQSRIHIQHVVLSLQPGGLENGVVNVINRLNPDRFRSSVCCLKQAGEFAARLKDGVAVHQMDWRGGNDLRLAWRLARLFRRTGTDVVHTRNAEAFFYGFLGAKIAAVRILTHSEHGRTFDDRPFRFWVQRMFSRHTDGIFAVSEQLKRDLAERVGIPAGRLKVIYNGVDTSRFVPSNRSRVRAAWGIVADELVVGSVGRLVQVKNYPLLLRAMSSLAADRVTIVLVGAGPERATLETMARDLGIAERVRFLGHREDVAELLPAMDVFVLPSVSEGMSNTLLEAMAAGVAVVASNVGGNPEIVRDQLDGLLFESGDEAGLHDRLQKMLADPVLRARMGRAGRERMLREFSMEAMITRYEQFYQSAFTGVGRLR